MKHNTDCHSEEIPAYFSLMWKQKSLISQNTLRVLHLVIHETLQSTDNTYNVFDYVLSQCMKTHSILCWVMTALPSPSKDCSSSLSNSATFGRQPMLPSVCVTKVQARPSSAPLGVTPSLQKLAVPARNNSVSFLFFLKGGGGGGGEERHVGVGVGGYYRVPHHVKFEVLYPLMPKIT
jgi:hypothetical protein